MPVLKKITVRNFRNIELQELEFSPNVNCITGNNGEGKTNLIDAVYYLSMTKSAFASSDRFNFRHSQDEFSIAGTYLMNNGLESRFSVSVVSGAEKKIKRDDKVYERISRHIGILPVVMVSPADSSMVSESGEDRRRFVNSVLSQTDAEYLSAVQHYGRLLLQRNRLLKDGCPDDRLMSVFDEGLAAAASPIFRKREEFVTGLLPLVQRYYEMISDGHETVSVEYRSDLQKDTLDSLLASSRSRDVAMRYTTVGIQRDDFVFLMDGYPIRKCGSQGQQKSFLVALKFAQYDIMRKSCGFAPMLLLDDLFDKLDTGRVSNLLKMVAGNEFGQIFLSDSNRERVRDAVEGVTRDSVYFEAVGGAFEKWG
ncbi:MAG: DNA replication and repair protein RecF [Bacteroidales bacterium]|nr:DNA replication and repair protein RecF [Bacteroidales bacterium]